MIDVRQQINPMTAQQMIENANQSSNQMNMPTTMPADNSSVLSQVNQASQNAQAPQAQPNQGNWLERLLPTIGGVALPVIGAALAPETGGLSLLATTALSGLGSAAGKAAQDVATGNKLGTDVLTAGALGAGGNLAGAGIAKGLGMAGSALTGLGESGVQAAEAKATQTAAQDEISRIGNEFGAIKPGQADVGNALENLKTLGVTKPTAQDALNVSKVYTGSDPETGDGVLNFYKKQALEKAGGTVDLSNTEQSVKEALADPNNQFHLGSLEPVSSSRGQLPKVPNNVANKIMTQVRNLLPAPQTVGEGADAQIAMQATPDEAKTLLTKIGSQIQATTPKANSLGEINPAQQAENDIWKGMYRNIKQSLYNRPEVNTAVAATRAEPEVIDDAIKANGITDPQVAANIKADLTDRINNGNQMQDWLSHESDMVNMGKVGKIQTDFVSKNPQVAKSQKALQETVPKATTGDNLLNLGAMAEATIGHQPLALLAPTAVKLAQNPQAQMAAGGILSKLAGGKLPSLIGQVAGTSPLTVAGQAGQGQQITGANMDLRNSLPYRMIMAEAVDPYHYGGNVLNQSLGNYQKYAGAEQAVQNLQNYFNAAGGAQGPIMGRLSELGSMFTGGPAAQYQQQAQAAQAAIAQALGVQPGQVALPSITQNQQGAQTSLNSIQNLLAALGGPNATAPAQ